jgi:hypothetical protein
LRKQPRAGSQSATTRRILIADPELLAAVVRRGIARFAGIRDAARTADLSPSEITKVLHQQRGSLSSLVVHKLEWLIVTKEDRPHFRDALVMPEAQDVLVREGERLGAKLRDAVRRDDVRDRVELTAHIRQVLDWDPLEFLARAVASRCLNQRFAVGRLVVAWNRIIDQLLESASSGGIELDWRELRADELEGFVEAGLVQQFILLDRKDDLSRARDAIASAPKKPAQARREYSRLGLLKRMWEQEPDGRCPPVLAAHEKLLRRDDDRSRATTPVLPPVAAPLNGKAVGRIRKNGRFPLREVALGQRQL